ncbi:MAG: 30S ribosomal protein S17 [Deltaproteobacteria bacterium]|nr:30S ribosomal protein S17 [Deltaproteobacteria bacterium]
MDSHGIRRTMQGVVVSNSMNKTVVVMTERLVKHPKFQKFIRRRKKYHAHDENNTCGVGDRVLIAESRPLSRMKRWRVRTIVEKAK